MNRRNNRAQVNQRAVNAPSARNRSSVQTGTQNIRVRECERFASVDGFSPYTIVRSSALNPGITQMFPWLAKLGRMFDKYKVHSVTFRYKNVVGTSSNGNVIMSFDFDTLDASPLTAVQQTQSTVYVDGAPWRLLEMSLPKSMLKQEYFIRTAATVSNSIDLKTYDIGRLHVATEGCSDALQGYLEIDYDIELIGKSSNPTETIAYNAISGFGMTALPQYVTVLANGDVPFSFVSSDGAGYQIDLTEFYLPPGSYSLMCVLRGLDANDVSADGFYELQFLNQTFPNDIIVGVARASYKNTITLTSMVHLNAASTITVRSAFLSQYEGAYSSFVITNIFQDSS